MKINLTINQVLLIFVAICSGLAAGSATLIDIFDAPTAKTIVGLANLLNTIIASIVAALSGQAGLVKQVAAMPGVEEIKVNGQANQVLASVAVDPSQEKVAPVEGQETIVKEIAQP